MGQHRQQGQTTIIDQPPAEEPFAYEPILYDRYRIGCVWRPEPNRCLDASLWSETKSPRNPRYRSVRHEFRATGNGDQYGFKVQSRRPAGSRGEIHPGI